MPPPLSLGVSACGAPASARALALRQAAGSNTAVGWRRLRVPWGSQAAGAVGQAGGEAGEPAAGAWGREAAVRGGIT